MVTTFHIDRWDITKILIGNGSQAEIPFLTTFDKMGFDRKQLRELSNPLYGFNGKRIKPAETITLPVSFGTPKPPRTEYITFDVIDMTYPYNAIFGRGLLNTFKAALHSTYLCLKVLATLELYPFSAASKKPETLKRASPQATKMYTFCESNQSSMKPNLRQNIRRP
jgi:hypothetical protein